MKKRLKVIKVSADSNIDEILAEVTSVPALLDRDGVFYRLSREVDENGWPVVTDEAYQRILDETLGSWADLDTDKIIEDVYRWREEGSRPPDRP